MKNKTFVFDANSIVSAFILKNSVNNQALKFALENGRIVVSEDILSELRDVLFRPKFDKYLSFETRLRTLYYFEVATDIITPVKQILACRDPKDDMYLDLVVSVSAKAIVTGDKDLLS